MKQSFIYWSKFLKLKYCNAKGFNYKLFLLRIPEKIWSLKESSSECRQPELAFQDSIDKPQSKKLYIIGERNCLDLWICTPRETEKKAKFFKALSSGDLQGLLSEFWRDSSSLLQ